MADRHPLEGLGPVALPGETELRNRVLLGRSQRAAMLAGASFPLLLLVGLGLAALAADGPGRTLWETITADPFQLALLIAAALVGTLQWLHATRERLFIGPGGLRYYSGLPRWLGLLGRDWSVAADRIRDAKVVRPAGLVTPDLLRIEFETGRRSRRVEAFKWADPDRQSVADFRVLETLRKDPGAIAGLFDVLPVVVFLRGAGFELTLPDPGAGATDSPLSRSLEPRIAAALGVVVAGLVYSLVDMAVISETYAAGAPMAMLLAGGIGGGALAWRMLGGEQAIGMARSTATIAPETASHAARLGVAALVGLAALAALYPGLIRLNRIGAPDPQPHSYRHAAEGRLEPAAADAPRIDLPDLVGMLPGSQPGDLHELWIRHGSLGFDQIDIDALDAWIRGLEQRAAAAAPADPVRPDR